MKYPPIVIQGPTNYCEEIVKYYSNYGGEV